jgi:hypothetical protein
MTQGSGDLGLLDPVEVHAEDLLVELEVVPLFGMCPLGLRESVEAQTDKLEVMAELDHGLVASIEASEILLRRNAIAAESAGVDLARELRPVLDGPGIGDAIAFTPATMAGRARRNRRAADHAILRRTSSKLHPVTGRPSAAFDQPAGRTSATQRPAPGSAHHEL